MEKKNVKCVFKVSLHNMYKINNHFHHIMILLRKTSLCDYIAYSCIKLFYSSVLLKVSTNPEILAN